MNIYVSSETFEAFLDFQSGKIEFVLTSQLLDEVEYLDCDEFTKVICIQIAQQFTIDQILQLQPSLQEIIINYLTDRNLLHIAPKLFPVQCYKYIKASFPLNIERIQQNFLNSINKQLFNSQTGIRLLSDNQSPLTTETEVSTSSVQIFTPGPDSFQILVQQCKTQYFNSILTKFVFERILSGIDRPDQIETDFIGDILSLTIQNKNAVEIATFILLHKNIIIELDLSKNNVQNIVSLTRCCQNIQQLILFNNNLDVEQMHQINKILKMNVLRKLYLNHNPIGELGAKVLQKGLVLNHSLEEFNISCCQLQCGVICIFNGLVNNMQLQQLDVSGNYICQNITALLVSYLTSTHSQCLKIIDSTLECDDFDLVLNVLRPHFHLLLSPKSLTTAQQLQLNSICYPNASTLQLRRIFEQQLLYGNDSIGGLKWFRISEPWLRKWRDFISGQTDNSPGPVQNERLGKVKGVDFRLVNESVFSLFVQIYGGGPIVEE
ncbi:DUSP_domain-containing protein [Hexamita inflata]|uniref:DUSP_domain-containing protein n=1 Tax=Hexamita inflata TaxID=28002 RepID=A0ABP1HWD5_9EUKA